MRELNATACAALYERVEWSDPWILVTLIVLAIVNVMVVLGNVLVILAVYHTSKLRNVTNMFIVSLAVADLMVGLAVLPFSATWEVFKIPHTTCQEHSSPVGQPNKIYQLAGKNNASEAHQGGDALQIAEVHAPRQVSQDHLVGPRVNLLRGRFPLVVERKSIDLARSSAVAVIYLRNNDYIRTSR